METNIEASYRVSRPESVSHFNLIIYFISDVE